MRGRFVVGFYFYFIWVLWSMVVFDGGGGSDMGWICSRDGCGF